MFKKKQKTDELQIDNNAWDACNSRIKQLLELFESTNPKQYPTNYPSKNSDEEINNKNISDSEEEEEICSIEKENEIAHNKRQYLLQKKTTNH